MFYLVTGEINSLRRFDIPKLHLFLTLWYTTNRV